MNKKTYFIRGCRSPTSTGFGQWDDAYIFIYNLKKEETIVNIFKDNRILESYKYNFDQGYKKYMDLLEDGWQKMDTFDLIITSGLDRRDIM